jgi:hypothetical protein
MTLLKNGDRIAAPFLRKVREMVDVPGIILKMFVALWRHK